MIVSNPRYLVQRNDSDSDDDMFLALNGYLCNNNDCKPVSSFSAPTKECANIVQSVRMDIFHSGPDGIDSVDVFVSLTSKQSEQKYLHQSYEYRHYWLSENVTETTVMLSGNPGYLVGKPVRAGYYDGAETRILEDNQALSVFTVPANGLCDFENSFPRYSHNNIFKKL